MQGCTFVGVYKNMCVALHVCDDIEMIHPQLLGSMYHNTIYNRYVII